MYYVYILQCSDGSYYTGYTNDMARRMARHEAGKASKYTRSRRPVRLVYQEAFPGQHEAMSRENTIKAMPRPEKEALIAAAGPPLFNQ